MPWKVQAAGIVLFDVFGKDIKHYSISVRGNSQIKIKGDELVPGIYFYKIFADKQEIAHVFAE